jgi:hypothetical protein
MSRDHARDVSFFSDYRLVLFKIKKTCTRFQLVIGRDCMRRPEVDNSRCE